MDKDTVDSSFSVKSNNSQILAMVLGILREPLETSDFTFTLPIELLLLTIL